MPSRLPALNESESNDRTDMTDAIPNNDAMPWGRSRAQSAPESDRAPSVTQHPSTTVRDLLETGQFERAHQQCVRWLNAQPESSDGWNSMAAILYHMQNLTGAADALRQSLAINPRQLGPLVDLGGLLQQLGDNASAVDLLRSATKVFPDSASAYHQLGNALRHIPHESEAAYRRALHLDGTLVETRCNLGSLLMEQGSTEEALALFEMATEIRSDHGPTWINLSALYNEAGQFENGLEAARRAVDLAPDSPQAMNNLGRAMQGLGRLEDAISWLRVAGHLSADLAHNYLFALGHQDKVADAAIAAAHRKWGQQVEGPVPVEAPTLPRGGRQKRRIRVGYVSGDFRCHVVARYFLPMLAAHDREDFEWFGYSEFNSIVRDDEVAQLIEQHFDHFRITSGAEDNAVAQQIRQDQIDILVDLAGHTKDNRLAVFARRPAPIQVSWLGYPHTTGLRSVDYFLTNKRLNPTQSQDHYTELLYYLDGPTAAWLPDPQAPEVSPLPALTNGHVTFGSLHRPNKWTAATLQLWKQVLEAMPDSKLIVYFPTIRDHHREKLITCMGQTASRVSIRNESTRHYLYQYHEIDIALDTTPWTGGTTTRDACWMGAVPIALCGQRRSARGSADVLDHLRLAEFIATDPTQYVALATQAASDLPQLARLRASLRERVEQTLCDAPRIVASVEDAYRNMFDSSIRRNV